MPDLSTMLTKLCGMVPGTEFRFLGTVQPLPSVRMQQWCDVVGCLLAHARHDCAEVRLTVQLSQAPDFFSVSVYADNDRFGRHLDEYPTDILIRLAKLDITSTDVDIYHVEDGSGIMIYANYSNKHFSVPS